MHFESNESNKILKFITFTILQKKTTIGTKISNTK